MSVLNFQAKHTDSSLDSELADSSRNVSALGERMRMDALQAIKQLVSTILPRCANFFLVLCQSFFSYAFLKGKSATDVGADDSSFDSEEVEKRLKGLSQPEQESTSSSEAQDSAKLHPRPPAKFSASGYTRDDTYAQCESALAELELDADIEERRPSLTKRRSSRARFANKVLGRLYSRRAYSDGLVFGSGHFLGDVSKMVAGLVSSDAESHVGRDDDCSSVPVYGFGDNRSESKDVTIYEQGVEEHLVHSSTLAAGKEGCVVLVFPRVSLIPFLDEYPGLLLSLLGTQVVV